MKNHSGFTLIEIIFVIVLVAMLSAVAGMGIVTGVQGYIFAKENAPTSMKSEFAMSRLSREFLEISNVTAATSNSIVYQSLFGDRSLAMVDTGSDKVIKIIDGTTIPTAGTGDVVIDKVSSFTLTYYNGSAPWVPGTDDARLLTRIKIDLVVNRPDSGIGTISFSTEVNPRNTGTFNVPIQ